MNEKVTSHKDLIVWQKSMVLCEKIYRLTENFPKRETYGLASQMRRASVSIPSNIAEGKNRNGDKEFAYFLSIAYGSVSELETQLDLATRLSFCSPHNSQEIFELLTEVSKMLRGMIKATAR